MQQRVSCEGLRVPAGFRDGEIPVTLVVGPDEVREMERERGSEVAVDRHQSLVPLLEGALVHPRLVVEAVAKGVGTQLDEVPPAAEIEREQDEMEATVGDAGPRAIPTIAGLAFPVRRDVGLDAENRLDGRRAGRGMELERRVEIAVIGDRDRGHAERLHPVDQLLDAVATVEQGVLAVEMEVDETVGGDRCRIGGGFRLFSCTRLGHQLSIRGRPSHRRRSTPGRPDAFDDRTEIHGIPSDVPRSDDLSDARRRTMSV